MRVKSDYNSPRGRYDTGGTNGQNSCMEHALKPRFDTCQILKILLVDEDGRIHHLAGAPDKCGQLAAAIFITDRFGEVFAAYRRQKGRQCRAPGRLSNG